MDPFKNQIDDRTSYRSLDEQFYDARLDRTGISQSDWPSQIDRAAIDVCYGVALGTTDSAFDHGGTIGRNDFGDACGSHYADGLRALAGSQSDLPRLIDAYDPDELGDLAFRLNELRVELEKLELNDSDISDLNRTTEALVEKLITQGASEDLARQPLQKPEAVADLLYQLFSDPAVTKYADVLIDAITSGTSTSIGNKSLLEHLDRPQMVTRLWDHQQEGIHEWVKADTQGYVNMATATGKTVLGLAAIAHTFGELHPSDTDSIPLVEASTDGKARVLIVAGQDLLLKQWQSEFDEHLNIPRSRTVQSESSEEDIIELTWGDIEFRTAQELLNNDLQDSYDLVILDEAHRYKSGRQGSRGWRDLFEELIDVSDSILAMSGSIDDEWLGDDSVKNALEANLEQCIEFTIEDARKKNVIADFRWDVCYAASDIGETVDSIASSTTPLAAVYNSKEHKFEPHELNETIPENVPDQFETLRDLRSFAHTNEGKQARENNDAFDRFATAAFSRKPKRWQLSPPAETISQLLEDHLPERKSVVLVQSYTQAETIGELLAEEYGDDLITVPEQATDAPYDSITEFKDASQGVLVGPGEVLGVGVDLPNADVAINLAKGGVNASLIQRIGRILRNPTGDKTAHFYQVVTLASDPEARLPGEDGRRLLRRASEFRALGSRFRENPGFVAADGTATEIIRVLETHGSQAKIKDERPTEEMVEDDVARRFLDELTAEIDSKVGESLSHPVLTTYWKPESLSPGTLPVQESVDRLDQDDELEHSSDTNTESDSVPESVSTSEKTDSPATVTIKIKDKSGNPVPDASVAIEDPTPIAETTTHADGEAIFNLPVYSDDVCVFVSKKGYQNYFTSISVPKGEHRVTVELADQSESTTMDNSRSNNTQEIEPDSSDKSSSDSPSRQEVIAEIDRLIEIVHSYPMRSDFINESDLEITDVYEHFDSWHDAYEAAADTTEHGQKDRNENKKQKISTDASVSEIMRPNNEGDSELDSTDPPSREEVLAEIRKVGKTVRRTVPMRSDFAKESDMDVEHVYEYFQSWSKAYRTSETPTKEEIKNEISRLQGDLGADLTKSEFEDHSDVDIEHVSEKFDSWHDAVQAADTSETTTTSTDSNFTQSDESKQDSECNGTETSNEEESHTLEPSDTGDQSSAVTESNDSVEVDFTQRDLVIELVSLTQELQRVPTQDEIDEYGQFTYSDYETEFGDLYEAAQQAGIIEDSVTRSEFLAAEGINEDSSESAEESTEVTESENSEVDQGTSQHVEDTDLLTVSASDFVELTAFQRDILIILSEAEDMSGLDIKSELEQYYDSDINHGRLYPNLDSLTDLGYVVKRSADKRTNAYELTELGRSLLKARERWVSTYISSTLMEKIEASQNVVDDDLSTVSVSDFVDLTGFQRDILIILSDADGMSGLDIKNQVEQYYDSDINHGRLYPNLDSLTDLGYVIKRSADKRTNAYELAELGELLLNIRTKWIRNRLTETSLDNKETRSRNDTPEEDNLSWTDAMEKELERYQKTHDNSSLTLSQIYEFSEESLSAQFPDNNHIRAKIRQQLQRLRDEKKVEFLDDEGTYLINIGNEVNQEKNSPRNNTGKKEIEEPRPADLISEVQRLDDEFDGYPLTTEMRKEGEYEPEQYYAEFGSWENALKVAGIDKEERLITEVRRVAQELGREPTTTDMGKHSPYSTGTHSQYFGSWSKALKLANVSEVLESVEATDREQSKESIQASTPFQDPEEASFDPQDPVNELHNQISGVGQATCGKLHKVGYETVRDLRTASKDEIAAVKHVGLEKAETILNFTSVDTNHSSSADNEQTSGHSVTNVSSNNNTTIEDDTENQPSEDADIGTQPFQKDSKDSEEDEQADSSDLVDSIMQDIENQFDDK